jgi:hypothetical protein
MESDYTTHLRVKHDFVKSLLFDVEIDTEIQDYLYSVLNLINKGKVEKLDNLDNFCLTTSNLLIKKEKKILDLSTFKDIKEALPLDDEHIERRKQRERDKFGEEGGFGRIHSLDLPPQHRWEGKHLPSKQSLHSVWPRVDSEDSYSVNPFSIGFHPLLEKNSKHGLPEFVEKLKNYYLTEDEMSLAEKHGGIELNHNSHHKKNDSMVLGNRFLHDLTEHGEGSATTEHALYERAFQKWKHDNRKEIDNLMSKENATEQDLRKMHFQDAANDWLSDSFQETTKKTGSSPNPLYHDIQDMVRNAGNTTEEDARDYFVDYAPEKYTEEQKEKYNQSNIDSFENTEHGHKLGWLGYNLGLEWLEPKDRSKVIEHLFEYGSSGEGDKGVVTLEDGITKLPLARIKRNFIKRTMGEYLWATGVPDRALPNTNAKQESDKRDSVYTTTDRPFYLRDAMTSFSAPSLSDGDGLTTERRDGESSGLIGRYSRSIHDDKHMAGNMMEHFVNEISDRLIGASVTDKELREEMVEKKKHRLTNIPVVPREIEMVQNDYRQRILKIEKKLKNNKQFRQDFTNMSSEERKSMVLQEFHKAMIAFDKERLRSRQLETPKDFKMDDLLNLVNPESENPLHSMFNDADNPIFEDGYLDDFKEHHEKGNAIHDAHREIRNDAQTFTRINGPSHGEVGDKKSHFDEYGGNLEGLASYWAHNFQRGGLGITPHTYIDILHNSLKNNLDDTESLIGAEDIRTGIMKVHPEMESLFSMFSGAKLPPHQRTPHTAGQLLSINHSSAPSKTRKSKTEVNHNMTEIARNPKLINTMREKNNHDFIRSKRMNRFQSVNDRSKTKGTGDFSVYDTDIAHNSSVILRDGVMRGGFHKPGDTDIATGRTLLGSPVKNYNVADFNDDLTPLPEVGDKSGLLEFLLRGNISSKDVTEDMKGLDDEMASLIEEITVSMGEEEGRRKEGNLDTQSEQKFKLQREEINRQYNNLQEEKSNLVMSHFVNTDKKLKDSPQIVGQHLYNHTEEKKADQDAVLRCAKEIIMPKFLEKDSTAFDTENSAKALSNVAQVLHDAELYLLHGNYETHGITTVGEALEQEDTSSIQSRLKMSPHKEIATALRDSGIPINQESDVEEVLAKMGLEPNEHNTKIVEGAIAQGKTHLATLGHVIAQGRELHPSQEQYELPEGVNDHASFIEHYNSEVKPKGESRKEKYDYARYHPLNNLSRRINMILQQSGNQENRNWGLDYHKLPKNFFGDEKKSMAGLQQKYKGIKNSTNRKLHQIISFDEGLAPNIDEIEDSGSEMIDRFNNRSNIQIDSTRKNGASPYLYYSSTGQRMHNGYMIQPSLASSIDRNGNITIGEHTQAQLMIPPTENDIQHLLGLEGFADLQQSIEQNPQNFAPYLQTQSTNLQSTNPQEPIPESANYQAFSTSFDKIPYSDLLKKLPKEMPLIEPYHKVFDYEDIEQLRGFTGEWVVTALELGERVKITKKSTYVELKNSKNKKIGVSDKMRSYIRKLGSKNFIMDGILNSEGLHIIDLMYYDDTDVTDMDTRERMKLLRSQFDSHENVLIPSPSTVRITDDEGLESAIKFLREENKDAKILLRDAKSTYMKGEEKHPKWILFTKSDDDYQIPFSMEINESVLLLNFDHDVLKFDIEGEKPVNPRSALSELNNSDYTKKLAKSLEGYWLPAFQELIKKEKVEDKVEDKVEGISDEDAEQIEEDSGGILNPKKDPNIIQKPLLPLLARVLSPLLLKQILEIMERSIDVLEKGHFPMTAGKGLGIDVGSDIESPRGPTKLTNEATLPDWDFKVRPGQDPEKEEDYPKKKKVKN